MGRPAPIRGALGLAHRLRSGSVVMSGDRIYRELTPLQVIALERELLRREGRGNLSPRQAMKESVDLTNKEESNEEG